MSDTHRRGHGPGAFVRGAGIVAAVGLLLAGCDLPFGEGPEDGAADGPAEIAADDLAKAENRAPDMDSIGGAEAMRVYYQFVDDKGGVHFVERLGEVPEAWRSRVGFVEMDRPPPLTPAEARASWSLSDAETVRVLAANPPPPRATGAGARQATSVMLYSAVWCGYCTKARQHLDGEGIDYEIRDVDIPAVAAELRDKTGRGGVPVLDYDGRVLRGYQKQQYDAAIREIRG